ncbi:hypothetical protein ASD88_05385 [Pelomonas sp. Root662]|nr:hypothetical protein ASC81_05380 [Pelomonas sp. Root405]KRA78265.1 hypothetical protein ASD88_05385 [Pelomonas sp. Root662]
MQNASLSALSILTEDHLAFRRLFARFEQQRAAGADAAARLQLARELCRRLIVHAVVEEELFYPAAFDALEDERVITNAANDHRELHALILQIEGMDARDRELDARMTALARRVAEHVQQEEGPLFTRLAFTSLDMEDLGQRIVARRKELMGEPGLLDQRPPTLSRPAGHRLQLKKR